MLARYQSVVVGCILSASLSAVSSADVVSFQLGNHPRGQVIPPYYGMRLDNLFGASQVVTFSFEDNGAGMQLDVDTDALTIHVFGTVYGGVDTGANWSNPELFDVDMMYTLIANNNGGWDADTSTDTGTITRQSDNMSWGLTTLFNENNHTFEFYPDRFRLLAGDLPGVDWVGRGWLDTATNPMPGTTRDFLFTATLIPLPAGFWLGAAGMCGVGVLSRAARRRRTSAA